VTALRDGSIVAIKGLGGYHLACLAENPAAVTELRRRKHRDEKPFALMVLGLTEARNLCEVDHAEESLLSSPRRPIVLLRRRATGRIAAAVAPGNPHLGIMLPYTPLHHLVLRELGGAPLVMTSGNASDEPIAYEDGDALERLAAIADLFLTHDRPIHTRCDDSVTRRVAGQELPLRRSRGYAPEPLDLPIACKTPTLALDGQMKVAFALGLDRKAFLSHYIGDLDDYRAYRSYLEAVEHYERLFALRPARVVHDLHPDYASTRFAMERAASLERVGVQHHHAHVASCMADNSLDEPVIGVAFDGTGYGTDRAVWGGEFLVGDYVGFRRAAHLRYVSMPGGEQAIREPWRMSMAHLHDAGQGDGLLRDRVPASALAIARRLIERNLNSPATSSMGRLFDAIAALVGIKGRVSYEGQAAMELEWLASRSTDNGVYPFEIEDPGDGLSSLVVDTRPLVAEVVRDIKRGVEDAEIGRRFHSTVVEIAARVCSRLRQQTGINTVALSGGVFQNVFLLSELIPRLEREAFRVYRHRRVPPGDGGLCFGQLAMATAT
jgi:hydrogenase maturation protein HypF